MGVAKKYAVISTKGGVGKTTLAANLGGILVDLGQRVLLVDTDHQQSLSTYYPLARPAPHGLRRMVMTADPTGCISQTAIPNLDLIVSDDPDKSLNNWIRQSSSHFQYLHAAMLAIDEAYDYIIIDTKGSDGTGELQELAIRASDILLSPIAPEWVAAKEFVRNTVAMLKRLEPPPGIQAGLPTVPPMLGLIYGLDRSTDTQVAAQQLRKTFYDESRGRVSILDTVVPSMAAYNQAAGRQMPVHRYETKRYNSPTPSAHDTMLQLVHELLPHLADIVPQWSTDGQNPVTRKEEESHGQKTTL
ncbi:MAG TPA: ParA family protein [Gammaproteobacteria bacterium]|nr:ParA family protein [Gammaproteobacteria bacterium]